MYHDKFVAGLEVWAIHIRSAVSPTWYCFLGVSIVGPSSGRSVKRRYKIKSFKKTRKRSESKKKLFKLNLKINQKFQFVLKMNEM